MSRLHHLGGVQSASIEDAKRREVAAARRRSAEATLPKLSTPCARASRPVRHPDSGAVGMPWSGRLDAIAASPGATVSTAKSVTDKQNQMYPAAQHGKHPELRTCIGRRSCARRAFAADLQLAFGAQKMGGGTTPAWRPSACSAAAGPSTPPCAIGTSRTTLNATARADGPITGAEVRRRAARHLRDAEGDRAALRGDQKRAIGSPSGRAAFSMPERSRPENQIGS